MDNKLEKKNAGWLLDRPIAHRGFHGLDKSGHRVYENSIESFKRAIEFNYIIELDLQLTLDNKIVVFHDSNLKRMCGKNLLVSKSSLEDIKKLKLKDSSETIPTLEEVLNFVDGKVPLVIELKAKLIPGVLERNVWRDLSRYNGLFAIQSFYPATILWFKTKKVNYPLGLIGGNKVLTPLSLRSLAVEFFAYVFVVLPDYIVYNHLHLNNYTWLKILRKIFKIPIITWTIDSLHSFNQIQESADNIIFENFEA